MQPGLLLEFARRGVVGVLPGPVLGDVEPTRRDLEQGVVRGQPPLAHEDHPLLGVERDDRDGTRMAGDVAHGAGPVGPLDGVDPEFEERPAMEDARVDDALDEIGPGVWLRGRWLAWGRSRRQAAAVAGAEVRASPVSESNRWSFSSGSTSSTMSPGLTRCDELTIATMSWLAALT